MFRVTHKRFSAISLLALLAAAALLSACSQGGRSAAPTARVQTYCPGKAAASLADPLALGNSPPRAYYQNLSIAAGFAVDITLAACDPDLGSGFNGLAWAITAQPMYGVLSTPWAGSYAGEPYQVTYTAPALAGTDRFVYHVNDGSAWGNTAEILLNVFPYPVSLAVAGTTSAPEGTVINFTATVGWSGSPSLDGQDYTASAAWSEDSAYATFTAPGVLSLGDFPSNQTVTVTAVFSANGFPVSDSVVLSVANVNQAPVANPGSLAVLPDTLAAGTLSGSDPDGGPSPLIYELVTGATLGSVAITNPNSGAYSYSPYAGQTGADSFTFRVYDGQDYSPPATISVGIAVPLPPTVSIGTYPTSVNEGSQADFAGTVLSDPDGTGPYSYYWDFGDGTNDTGQTVFTTSYTDGPAAYTVTLTVTNAQARNGTDSVAVSILNVAPTATAAADTANTTVDQTVGFSSAVNDPGVADTHALSWSFGDGSPASTAANPSHAYTAAGSYTVVLTADDHDGGIGTDSLVLNVAAPNSPPAPVISAATTVSEGSTLPVTVTVNDPDGPTPHSYIIDYGDGNAPGGTTSAGSFPADYTWIDDAVYAMVATVTDGSAAAGSTSQAITVLNVAPTATAGADTANTTVGQTVGFVSAVSDPGVADTHALSWSFGDGSPASTATNPSHAYTTAGSYTVVLTADDHDGGIGTDSLNINVAAAVGGVWYVDQAATAVYDGTSWTTAFLHPADAMAVAASGDQVWVAAGNYLPPDVDPNVPVLALVPGVAVYGGFIGGETALGQRDWGANTTVLNGDSSGAMQGTGDVYSVVTGASGAGLDGFWVVNGNATGFTTPPMATGGGIYAESVIGMTVRNSVIAYNVANDAGGGMYITGGDGVTIETVNFSHNYVFNPTSGFGGGLAADGTINTTVHYCLFDSNDSAWRGGAVGLNSNSLPTYITRSWIEGNTAADGGAYAGLTGAGVSLDNTLLARNQATGNGGAVFTDTDSAGLDVSSSTFAGNSAGGFGGGIYSFATISNQVVNSVLWGDNAASGSDSDREVYGPVTVSYSDVDRGALGAYTGTGNINSDPAFADSAEFRPTVTSPCVDAGDNLGVTSSVDLAGAARITDGNADTTATVDMGAWEWQPGSLGRIFFQGDHPVTGNSELLSWDAQNGVSVLSSVTNGLVPQWFAVYQGRLYFNGWDPGGAGFQLMSWNYPAGALSTHTTNSPQLDPRDLAVYDGKLFMNGTGPSLNYELDSWDGAALATGVSPTSGGSYSRVQLVPAFGKLYYESDVYNLWSYDSASSSATLESSAIFIPSDMVPYNDQLFMTAVSGSDRTLWSFDPVSQVATSLRDPGGSTDPQFMTPFDGKLFFSALSSVATTRQLISYNALDGYAVISTLAGLQAPVPMEGKLYFVKQLAAFDEQVFSWDEWNGQLQQETFSPQVQNVLPQTLVVHEGKLHFVAYDTTAGMHRLWSLSSSGVLNTLPPAQDLGNSYEHISFVPGNPPIADATGTWGFNETIGANDCGDPVGSVFPERVAIMQRGSEQVAQTEHGTVNLRILGADITGTSVYPEGLGVTVENFTLTLGAGGNTIIGSSNWSWDDGSFFCTGGSSYVGSKD